MVPLIWKEHNVRPVGLSKWKREGLKTSTSKAGVLCSESVELGFRFWSVTPTNNEPLIHAVRFHLTLQRAYSLVTPCLTNNMFYFSSWARGVAHPFLWFEIQLDTSIKLQNLFNWSSVFVLITHREMHNSQVLDLNNSMLNNETGDVY